MYQCHRYELLYLVRIGTSLSAPSPPQHQVSDVWSAGESYSSVALFSPGGELGASESGRDSLAMSSRWKSCLSSGPRFHCHQLVVANNVLSVNSHVAAVCMHTHRTVKCRAGGGVCVVSSPAYFVIAPSVSLLGWMRRREEGWPVLNSVL